MRLKDVHTHDDVTYESMTNNLALVSLLPFLMGYSSGLIVIEKNYLDVYIYDRWSENCIPDLHLGERITPFSIKLLEGTTTAPNLLTESDLIGLMDRSGIGE